MNTQLVYTHVEFIKVPMIFWRIAVKQGSFFRFDEMNIDRGTDTSRAGSAPETILKPCMLVPFGAVRVLRKTQLFETEKFPMRTVTRAASSLGGITKFPNLGAVSSSTADGITSGSVLRTLSSSQ